MKDIFGSHEAAMDLPLPHTQPYRPLQQLQDLHVEQHHEEEAGHDGHLDNTNINIHIQRDHTVLYEWSFTLSTVVSSPTTTAAAAVSDTLGVVEIDPSDRILATAGIARKIRIYTLNDLLLGGNNRQDDIDQEQPPATSFLDHATACSYYICTPAKLSSLRWRPNSGGHVAACGDYDGVVTEYDLERRVALLERDEHGGRRVWSVDYSKKYPPLAASGSDDATAQLWDPRCGGIASVVRPGSPVCCVEFDPAGGDGIALGAADRRAYLYDSRKMSSPVVTFTGHRRTVTYVRFLAGGDAAMVSAGTDGCLRMWAAGDGRPVRTYRGHVNRRSFVGLSVWRGRDGVELMGCGSETNEVVVYDRQWSRPVWTGKFGRHDGGGFVSSVCWRPQGGGGDDGQCTLVAGGSDGVVQVFAGARQKKSTS